MGLADATSTDASIARPRADWFQQHYQLVVLLFASIIFGSGAVSPPYLVDDVDAVQAQIARNMLRSGDWVTARLDGVAYMEKAPLKYWAIALCYRIFGVHDWSARLVIALAAVLLCWVTAWFGAWAMDTRTGLYAGLVISTCIGLFLFTRILIPDVLVTLWVTLAIWSAVRAIDSTEKHGRWWARAFWFSLALGILTKGLIGVIFPVGTLLVYLLASRQLLRRVTWRRLLPLQGLAIFLVTALPWHVAATLANPPYFDFTLHSESGSYHGFFWFYFINEQLLRFLNLRYPRDYNTVPRPLFWIYHLLWLFPWSVYLARVRKLRFRGSDRAARMRLLALCWIGVVLVFFTFSTTQEYYSLPCYPAFATLIGAAMADPRTKLERGAKVAGAFAALAGIAMAVVLWAVRATPAPGDIASALHDNPELYSLSLGHVADLSLRAFAYLKLPLAMALVAMCVGVVSGFLFRGRRAVFGLAVMMVLFFQATRVALHVFDPYLGSWNLAEALRKAPPGRLIVGDEYYSFSSVFFYADATALLLNGRKNNLEYGSYAPGAPNVFITDSDFPGYWDGSERVYLLAESSAVVRLKALVGADRFHQIAVAGGKYLLVNQ